MFGPISYPTGGCPPLKSARLGLKFKIVSVSILGVSHVQLACSLPKLVLFLLGQKVRVRKKHRLRGQAELGANPDSFPFS